MYDFFYRINTPQWYVTKISARYRLLITLSVCLLILSIWFYVVWQPLQASLAFYEGMHVQADAAHSLNPLADNHALLEDKLKTYNHLCDAYALASPFDAVAAIMNSIEGQGLTFCAYQPQGTNKHDWYTEHSFLMEVKGSFAALHTFFDQVKQESFVVILEKVRMSKVDDNQICATCLFTVITLHDVDKERYA